MTRFLHVANGTSTTRSVHSAGIPGAVSIWADPLHDGPVPAGLSDAELLEVRVRHLGGNPASLDPMNDLRRWRAVIERHDVYDELILWYEHDLFDQLNLIQLLTWIHDRLPASKPVSLVCIGSFPGRPAFKGLGELTPEELAPLLETRKRVSMEQYALAARAWHAFREPAPHALNELRSRDISALPYLAAALTRFLQEYPWTFGGVSRTERRLLELAEGDGIALRAAFPRMHEGENAYYVTDDSLAEHARDLTCSSPPLLELASGSRAIESDLRASVRLTEIGRSVLAGKLDRVVACGIDRWLGGVHLQSPHAIWRWDAASQRITQS